jgi:glycosyltransferase involved in cell wall biosynthesis
VVNLKNILYISPKFPALSLVFEQNEMLGIQANEVNITILSCRKFSVSEIHHFAQCLLDKVLYPNYRNALLGLILCLNKSPISFFKVLVYTLVASANPFAIKKKLAAFVFTLGWYAILADKTPAYDWIHADFGQGTATVALMLSELLKCPFSFKVHAFDIYDKSIQNFDLLKVIKIKQATKIFSAHEYGKQKILKMVSISEEKVITNYTSIRTNDFQPLSPVLKSKRFVSLGRLVTKKGFSTLIKASNILHKKGEYFTVDIYGSGPEQANLMQLIEINGLQDIVCLKGKYKNENLPDIFTDCIALVMPSIMDKNGDMDGIPTVIYEAMSLGRTVIASKISGIPEVVKDKVNGYLIEPGSFEQLAERMKYLLSHPEMSFQLGKEGRRLVEENHEYKTNAKSLIESINKSLQANLQN